MQDWARRIKKIAARLWSAEPGVVSETNLTKVRAAVIWIEFRLLEKFDCRLAVRTAKFDPKPTSPFMQREKYTSAGFQRLEKTRVL
jgi:hypothetical protein